MLVVSHASSIDRALEAYVVLNTWRASVHRPLPEPTKHPSALNSANDLT
jgi:hypothetical protein